MKKVIFMIFLWSQLIYAANYFDLNHYKSNFILKTKRITVPGYPYAFNPSIIRWRGKILMSFRTIPGNKKSFNSEIGLMRLDPQFNPIGEPQLLALRESGSLIPCRAEDGRLIQIKNHLYLIYSDCSEMQISRANFRVHVAELGYDGKKFIVLNKTILKQFEGQSDQIREKNWVPFNYQNELLLSYSIDPHFVLSPLLWSEKCVTISLSDRSSYWGWGALRGGTPALLIDGQYLAFFHSSIELATVQSGGANVAHYFMGAYTFDPHPPFNLRKVSASPIIAEEFYSGEEYNYYWKPIQAIFPCGFIEDGSTLWVAYGRQDHETWVVQLDKKGLMNSLAPTY